MREACAVELLYKVAARAARHFEIADRLGPLAKPLAADLRPLTTDSSLGEYARVVLAKIDPKME